MKRQWIGLVLATLAIRAPAQEQDIGFVETFSLAADRAAVLKELVPGTDEYYYYHALHAQNLGQREEFQRVMDLWVRARDGTVVADARTLLNRQALLDYERDPAATLDYIRHELNLYFPHARKTGERRSDAPTALDPVLISVPTLMRRALANDPRNLNRIEDVGLDLVDWTALTPDQRRSRLARLRRPDVPGLVEAIVADLDYKDSRGFGHHEIHRALTRAQLDDLLQKRPALRNEAAFVAAYLAKLAPEDEADLDTDPAARQAYLDRLWAFAQTLDPVHNSLKACVLYHRLRHDLSQGVWDHDRFVEYLKLPRDVWYLPVEVRRTLPRGDYLANLNQGFNLVSLTAIGDEQPVVRAMLLHFLRDAPTYDEFRPWVRDDYLKPLFAETKIVHGVGDPQQWAALLPPEDYKRLKERVDLDFAPDNPVLFGVADPVKLTVFVKNVRDLRVRVYEINTPNYYRETGRPLNLAINLDGLVATSEEAATYTEPPERRVARTFEFPKLTARGVYVIEWIGNGISSRALVQKGRLNVVQTVTANGHAFTVFDEANRRVTDARAWLGGQEFPAGPDGRILVPFSTAPAEETIVIQQGAFATLTRFEHRAESYALKAGFYLDREALLRGATARLAVRPVLLVNGRATSLQRLEEVKLRVQAVDVQGISTQKEFANLDLKSEAETVVDLGVPDNAASLTVTLTAKIRNVSRNRKEDVSDSASFALNGMDRTPAVQDLHVGLTDQGYVVDLRGKNGEPRPGEPLALYFKHRAFRDEVAVQLKTDEQGRVRLGALEGIERFRVREPMGTEHTWPTVRGACVYPDALQGAAGETLRVPWVCVTPEPLGAVSLLETRQGGFVKDWHAALAMSQDGFLELRDLPAGEYSLLLKPEDRALPVRITAGETRDGFALSPRRALEVPRLAPLQVAAVEPGKTDLVIRLANANAYTRVHVLATRYLPAYDVFARLGFTGAPGPLAQPWTPAQTYYESGRDLGDEYRYILDRAAAKKYPGNMLDRPGLLLNPWAVRDTAAEAEILEAGGAYAGRAAGLQRGAAAPRPRPAPGRGEADEGYASLDFLATGAVTLLNLAPDKDGTVRVSRAALQGLPFLRVVAADPTATIVRPVALADTPVALRDLRLAAGLDPAKSFAEQKLVTVVPAQGALEIADAATARWEIYGTVAKAYRLLATLGGNSTFAEFAFVADWPTLDAREQRRLYSKYACHELNFFLYHKDPKFFREVIAPNLANKKDKTFLDRWLLNEDLASYLEPWRFGRLNAVEQILLGKRLKAQTASVVRDIRERADLIPPDLEDFNRRFDTAVQSGSLEAGGAGGELGRGLANKIVALDATGMMAPTAAPPPAPAEPAADMAASEMAAAGLPASATLRLKKAELEGRREAADHDKDGFFADEEKPAAGEGARRFFQALDQTKEWAENNYYQLPIGQQTAELVTVNEFWADYAAHDGKAPFLSTAFPQATRSFTEMMLALAVLDLPFEAKAGEEKRDGARCALRPGGPAVVFHREIRETAVADAAADPVLVAQFAFRADDRYRFENNERFDKPITGEFLPHVVYGVQVALTNPGGTPKKLHALLQIPRGSLPVNGGQATRGVYLELAPYTTRTLEYFFYFPEVGTFPQYPVAVARNGQVIARAAPMTYAVVPQLTQVDKTSWAWISQNGTEDETLAFLAGANVHRLDLDEIAWRMHEKAFFRKALSLLEARHVYLDTLWSYGLLHNDPDAIRAYLRHSPFAGRCGLRLVSPLLTLDPVERFDYQHLEYAPLVNPRAHPVGEKRKILNAGFREQYRRFMKVLSEQATLTAPDQLAVAYYLALQDRVEEALDWFGRVKRADLAEKLQYDYLDAYLAFYRGDIVRAKTMAQAHADEGVDRWRDRFALVLSQVEEIERGVAATAAVDPENRDQTQAAEAARAPALDLQVEAGKIRLDYRNVTACTLNFYPMDIELLFSRNPFLQEGAAQFAFIRPVLSREVALPAGRDTWSADLPEEFRARNVMVEAVAGGVRKAQAYYANTLKVQVIEPFGQVVVTHAETHKPVPGAYVKVYAKRTDGSVAFFKDGYTDLRGRFDYASLNTNDLDRTERLAILVLSPDYGALVREAAPPKK